MTKGTIFHRLLIGNRSWILTRSDITAAPAAAAAALSVRAHVPYHTQISFGYISLKLCRYVRRWVSDYPSPFKGLISTDLWTRCASRRSFEFDRLTSIGKFIVVVFVEKSSHLEGEKTLFLSPKWSIFLVLKYDMTDFLIWVIFISIFILGVAIILVILDYS